MTTAPPLGALIEGARKRRRLSQNAAAAAAGISGTHWRRVVQGEPGTAETVARMAHAVGVTPAELEQVGRGDAADELRVLDPVARQHERRAQHDEREQRAADGTALVDELRELADRFEAAQQDPEQRAALLAVLRAMQRTA